MTDIETQLVDLTEATLGDLRDPEWQQPIEEATQPIYSQVERPRYNLGSGPPGRVD